jgi:CRP/FNR family transcriptional regulator, cyclic AMP receptor protein
MSLYSNLNAAPGALKFVKSFPLFKDLSAEEYEEIAKQIQHRTFAHGIILFHQDMPSSRMLYMIEDGWIRIYSLGRTGTELTLTILGRGDVLGEMSVLDNQYHSATALTLTTTNLWLLPKDNLESLLERSPSISRQLIKILVGRMRTIINHTEALTFQDVPGRLAYEILTLAQRHGTKSEMHIDVDLPLTQSDLATMVGATRESVNKALAMLRSHNLVQLDGSKLVVIDLAGLQHIVFERGR